jgi:CRISPR-associated protein Csb3
MTQLTLAGCEPRTLLSHMALYGLAAILEAGGVRDVRLGWAGTANPQPCVSAADADDISLAELVLDHARTRNTGKSWARRDVTFAVKSQGAPKTATKALMSPRLSQFAGPAAWELVQQSRWEVLDELTAGHHWLDLRFLAALGEPCYWSCNRKGDTLQDDGASRLEMQPRNQGSEFVGTRLRKLADTVAQRDAAKVLAGLTGQSVDDELGDNSPGSRTATGLASPGPTDNALAWCALWGISQFPLAMRINDTAQTSGHFSRGRKEWFYVPMWQGAWRPARLRSVLASQELRTFAGTRLTAPDGVSDLEVSKARAWLRARGVEGAVRFEILKFGSDNAPERRAMSGHLISVRGTA